MDEHKKWLSEEKKQVKDPEMTTTPSINRKSQKLERDEPVETILYSMAKVYEDRKERKRVEKELADEKEMRSTPTINPKSHALKREGKVEERLTEMHNMTLQKTAKQRENLEQEREKEVASELKFHPEISRMASKLKNNMAVEQRLHEWNKNKEANLEKKKVIAKQNAESEVTGTPSISNRSQKLAKHLRPTDRPLHDVLLEEDERKKRDAMEKKAMIELSEAPGYPRITAYAASLVRPGDVADRLYEESLQREQKLRMLVEESFVTADEYVKGDDKTRQLGISPYGRIRTLPVETDMATRDEETRKHREEKAKMKDAEVISSAKPVINSRSRELEAKMVASGKILPAADRIVHVKTASKAIAAAGSGHRHGSHGGDDSTMTADDPELTFRPQINPVSVELANKQRAQSGSDRTDALLKLGKTYEEKRKRAAEYKKMQEMEECTFKPKLNHSSKVGSYARPRASGPEGLTRWFDSWEMKRTAKLERMRHEKESEAMKECTFMPSRSSSKAATPLTARTLSGNDLRSSDELNDTHGSERSYASSRPSSTRGGASAYGVEQHLERQSKAREAKSVKKEATWTGELTTPQAFRFTADESSSASAGASTRASTGALLAEQLRREVERRADQRVSAELQAGNLSGGTSYSGADELSPSHSTGGVNRSSAERARQHTNQSAALKLGSLKLGAPAPPEWTKRSREKHRWEKKEREQQDLEWQRPWRDQPAALSASSDRLEAAGSEHSAGGTPAGNAKRAQGEEAYVRRMQKAREAKAAKETTPAYGEAWTPTPTQPKEFQLGNKRPAHIAALSKPVSPPYGSK